MRYLVVSNEKTEKDYMSGLNKMEQNRKTNAPDEIRSFHLSVSSTSAATGSLVILLYFWMLYILHAVYSYYTMARPSLMLNINTKFIF